MRRRVLTIALVIAAGRAQTPNLDQARSHDAKGVALAESGRLADSAEEFQEAVRLAPEFPEARYHLAIVHDRLGKTDDAMTGFEETLCLRPDFIQARYLLAGCCRKRGDFEGEKRLLATIARSAPEFAEARFNYGLALQRSEKIAEAIEQLQAASRLEPKNAHLALALGVALAGRDQPEAIRVLHHAVELAPGNAEPHYNLALAIASSGNEAGAVREFEEALRRDPKHSDARRGLGVALLHQERLRESAQQLRRATELAPRDAEAANNLGLVLLRLKDIQGAIAALEQAVSLNPKLIKARFNLAQAYQRSGRTGDARLESQRAAALTAEQRSLGRAMVLLQSARQRLQSEDGAGALASLREAVGVSPAFPEAHLELGRTILEIGGDPAEAIREFRRVLNLDPECADAHYEIGLALLKIGDKAQAFEELKAAAAMAPCRVEIMRALRRVALDVDDRATVAAQSRRVLALEGARDSADRPR